MPETRTWLTEGPAQTAAIAAEIAAWIPKPAVVQMSGNLGAGKTTLTKSLVEAWQAGSADEVSSPTFTLVQEYGEPVSVYHIDLYRLETPSEYHSLGLDEIFDSPARVVIEWGEKFARFLPKDRWIITLRHTGEESREITVSRP